MAGSLKPVIWFGQFLKIYYCRIQQPYGILHCKESHNLIVITKHVVVQDRFGVVVLTMKLQVLLDIPRRQSFQCTQISY
jgi:hypothetical protein